MFQHVIILLYIDKIVESGLNYGQQQALDLCLYILRKEPYKHVVDEDDKHLILVLHPIMGKTAQELFIIRTYFLIYYAADYQFY